MRLCQGRMVARSFAFGRYRPAAITSAGRLMAVKSTRGLASSSSKSARFPAAIVPCWSCTPRNSAGRMVAACKARSGGIPASTNSSSSRSSESPGHQTAGWAVAAGHQLRTRSVERRDHGKAPGRAQLDGAPLPISEHAPHVVGREHFREPGGKAREVARHRRVAIGDEAVLDYQGRNIPDTGLGGAAGELIEACGRGVQPTLEPGARGIGPRVGGKIVGA